MSQKKLKIRKSILKRFKITRSGKVLFRGSHMRHLRRKKRKTSVRRQKRLKEMKGQLKEKVKRLLGKK